jgi:hypothetical protein
LSKCRQYAEALFRILKENNLFRLGLEGDHRPVTSILTSLMYVKD